MLDIYLVWSLVGGRALFSWVASKPTTTGEQVTLTVHGTALQDFSSYAFQARVLILILKTDKSIGHTLP